MPIDLTQRGGEDMTRLTTAVLALGSVVWLSAAATAQQAPMATDCDKWIARINSEAGIRVDEAGWKARQNVDDIYKMCKDGKMAEAQKIATDTMAMLGIKL
jgi:hypothetical protein